MWQRGGACGRPGLAAPGGARRPGAGRGRPRAGARVVAASLGRRRLLRAGAERPAVAGGPRSGRDGARRRRTGGTSAPPAANQSLASLPAWGLFPRETVYPSCLCWEWPLACVSPWTWPSTSRAVSLHAPGRVLTSLDAHGTLLGWTGCTSSRGCQNQGRRLDLRKALSPHSKGRGPAMTPGAPLPSSTGAYLALISQQSSLGHTGAQSGVCCAPESLRGEKKEGFLCAAAETAVFSCCSGFSTSRASVTCVAMGGMADPCIQELCVVGRAVVKILGSCCESY